MYKMSICTNSIILQCVMALYVYMIKQVAKYATSAVVFKCVCLKLLCYHRATYET